MSEKKKPTYDLEAFQEQCAADLNATLTALRDAAALGFDDQGIIEVVQTMRRIHFYKSMTSHKDATIWQDVYHVPSEAGLLYVKFTSDVIAEFLLLSFKEKDNGW